MADATTTPAEFDPNSAFNPNGTIRAPYTGAAGTPPATTTTPPAGQDWTVQQIEQEWIAQGGPPAWAPTMAAVAYYGESGGKTDAVNTSISGEGAPTGLFQIYTAKQSPAFQAQFPASTMKDPIQNIKAAIALLNGGSGISNWGTGTGDPVGTAAEQNGGPLSSTDLANIAANGPATPGSTTGTGTGFGSAGAPPTVPGPKFAAPMQGVDIKNFHGFDLSAFMLPDGKPGPDLGNAEASIQEFATSTAVGKDGLNLQQRLQEDFGYTTNWALKHPEVGAVLIWTAQHADPSTAAGKAQEMSYLQKTQWFQTTSENQRAFEAAQSTDPAKAAQALVEAQDKVHATAAQMGVNLSPQQLQKIALAYAAQAYTPSGTIAGSATASQEFIDQQIVDAVTTVQKTGGLPGVGTSATFNPTTTESGTGIAPQLFQQLKAVAQQYLMYSSSPSSPLKDSDLENYVASYMQNYVGTGSYGSSNLINGAVQNFTGLMQQQASGLYSSLAPVIKMGTTPQTYTKPITNLIEGTLGLTQGSVDLTQPKWNWALGNDPTTGAPMTQDQILAKVVQMPEYDKSDTAINNAHTVANGLTNLFGLGGS